MSGWRRWVCGMVGLGLASCGGLKPEPEEPLDPYLPAMSVRINEVLYSKRSSGEMLDELARLGVVENGSFEEFKHGSGIRDWFIDSADLDGTRHTSLTCGLSPVVDDAGRMICLYRNRKRVDERFWDELRITP